MLRSLIRKRIIVGLVGAGLTLHLAACGTILHPERRGQPSGRLDPGIVLLDGLGLLLFFVPGVIAFAVDFSNGTIYLPSERADASMPLVPSELRTVRMSAAELTPERLETVIREKTGQSIRLQPGTYRATRLQHIDEMSGDVLQRLQSSSSTAEVAFPSSKN